MVYINQIQTVWTIKWMFSYTVANCLCSKINKLVVNFTFLKRLFSVMFPWLMLFIRRSHQNRTLWYFEIPLGKAHHKQLFTFQCRTGNYDHNNNETIFKNEKVTMPVQNLSFTMLEHVLVTNLEGNSISPKYWNTISVFLLFLKVSYCLAKILNMENWVSFHFGSFRV